MINVINKDLYINLLTSFAKLSRRRSVIKDLRSVRGASRPVFLHSPTHSTLTPKLSVYIRVLNAAQVTTGVEACVAAIGHLV